MTKKFKYKYRRKKTKLFDLVAAVGIIIMLDCLRALRGLLLKKIFKPIMHNQNNQKIGKKLL